MANPSVTWSISPQVGSINNTAFIRAEPDRSAASIMITATVKRYSRDVHHYRHRTVIRRCPIQRLSCGPISCRRAGLPDSAKHRYVLTRVSMVGFPQGVGTIDSFGLYTAPATIQTTDGDDHCHVDRHPSKSATRRSLCNRSTTVALKWADFSLRGRD